MEKNSVRRAVVAGQFYPASAQGLRRNIESLIDVSIDPETKTKKYNVKSDVIACMLPHAGYMYSGQVAGKTVSSINIKDRVILLGPNHTGYGANFSIICEGTWETPLGNLEVDSELAKKLLNNCPSLREDLLAHAYEHSLEVELPFLQYFKENFKIVPISILSDDLHALKEIGRQMGEAIKELNIKDNVLLVASTDMTHYEPYALAKKKDKEAIEAILELDEDKLIDKVKRLNISMCGYAAVAVMLSAAKYLGAKTSRLIHYQTSGDVTRDFSSVVGYAGIVIY